jgi:hypothetical protein
VNITIDLSGSTTMEQSPELARRLTGLVRDGFAQQGLDTERLRG